MTDAKDQTKARKVLDRILTKLGSEANQSVIEAYHKGGFELSFATMLVSESWAELVLEVLASAQIVGYGWHLSGSILDNLDACCDKPSIPGVTWIHVACPHDQEA